MGVTFQTKKCWCALVLCVAALDVSPFAAAAGKPDERELTPEQKAEVRAVRKAFSSAGKNIEKQQKAVDEAIKIGPHAAAPLVRVIEAKYKGRLKKYKSSVGKATKKMGAKRLITSVDELLDANSRLKKNRDALEKISAMHASLQRVLGASTEQDGAANATAPASDTSAKGKDASNGDKQQPALFDRVAMIEFVALGIGAPGMSQREVDCVLWTNRYRAKHGLRLLWADAKLSDSARMHSKDMVEHDFRAHESPLPGKKTFRDRGKMFDTRADGENIAEAPFSGEKIVEYWLDSPPHKANIEHPKFRRIGVGLHNDVWTQVFGGIDSFEQ